MKSYCRICNEQLTSLSRMLLQPTFSPDGRQIRLELPDSDGSHLYLTKADGSNVRQIPGEDMRLLMFPPAV